jgi:hypothetical protein
LRQACSDRLAEITWFKADWQRGGAATGTSKYHCDDGSEKAVLVKLPVGPRELIWTRRLQSANGDDLVVPQLYDSGSELGGYDLAWMVMERFEHGPLGLKWHEDHVARIADATARFQQAAASFPAEKGPESEPWDKLMADAIESVRTNHIADEDRWLNGLKKLKSRLSVIADAWESRPTNDWCHGDVHIANAMSRHAMDNGSVSLIDLADIHRGHWIEDGVYLERQLWARPERMKRVKPVKALAEARRRLSLAVDEDYTRLGMIRRVLLAGTAPRFMKSEGHPAYLAACLQRLETGLKELEAAG